MGSDNEGIEFYNLFQDLGLNTGKIGPNQINAWYETDSDTVEFLNWFKTSINNDNALTAQEHTGFEAIIENDLVLPEEKYKFFEEKVMSDYPGIFEIDSNQWDINLLKDELSMYSDVEIHLDHQISVNEMLNKKLKDLLAITIENEVQSKIRKEIAKQNCCDLSKYLDNANIKLRERIVKYGETLINFENTFDQPLFISNMNIKDFSTDIHFLINNEIQKQRKLWNLDLESSYKKLDKSILNNEVEDALDIMLNRISKSILKSITAQAKYEEIEATLKYLNNLDLADLSYIFNGNYPYQLEALVVSKRQQNNITYMNLGNIAKETAKKCVMFPKLLSLQKDNKYVSKQLEIFSEINSKYNKVLSLHFLLLLFYDRECTDIKMTDNFFKDIYQYITYDLHNCKLRTDKLISYISEYHIYKDKPFEQKFKLISDILTFIDCNEKQVVNFETAINTVNEFRNSCKNMERKAFSEDFDLFKEECKHIENNICAMKKFLISGPTAGLVSIPYQLYQVFEEVKEAWNNKENYMKSIMLIPSETQKKISSNQWLRLRRQLWIYFVTEPKKLLSIISQIENEIRLKRNENI